MSAKSQNVDLLTGRILPSLTALAVPIMATSLVQMAYSLTDMAWIGRAGSGMVASVGAAGMYTWLSSGLVTVAKIGGQVKAAHSIGEGDRERAGEYATGAIWLTLLFSLGFGAVVNGAAGPLIGFFGLQDPKVIADAVAYVRIACGLIIFSFLSQTLTGLYTAAGNSKTPFVANCIGMAFNILLDPVLIFGPGPFPALGAAGAAIATVTAQALVVLVLLLAAGKDEVLFPHVRMGKRIRLEVIRAIVRLGLPAGIQGMFYCGISMVLTRFVAAWGELAVAAQRVGSQIESISWMTAEGFGTAINAFVGQNFGGRQFDRVKKGYMTAAGIVFLWGSFTSALLIFGSRPVFTLFIREEDVVPVGMDYLRIIGFSQMFMSMEMMTGGALSGLGRTFQCSVINVLLTGARIPLALLLGRVWGLDGIWWAFSLSSIVKGIVFFLYQVRVLRKLG